MEGQVETLEQTPFLPAIATCLSDAFDGSIIGVVDHERDAE